MSSYLVELVDKILILEYSWPVDISAAGKSLDAIKTSPEVESTLRGQGELFPLRPETRDRY